MFEWHRGRDTGHRLAEDRNDESIGHMAIESAGYATVWPRRTCSMIRASAVVSAAIRDRARPKSGIAFPVYTRIFPPANTSDDEPVR